MAQLTITDFCRLKFPPNCEPECKKSGTKCIASAEYKGRMMDKSMLNSIKRPNSVISNSSSASSGQGSHNNSSSHHDNPLTSIITRSSIIGVINNKDIREDYNLYLNKLHNEAELKSKIGLYQLVTSDNFLKLVESLHIDDGEYREHVMRYENDLGFHAMEEIYRIVKARIQRTAQNTNYKMLTPRNVMVTEDIESLGISDFASISRLFTDIRYHRKFSSSPSLVFNGKLAIGASSNAVKARNSLRPEQMFFFKIFPVGTQIVEIENRSGKKVPAEIEYDTKGLQTEIKMYTELLKLVKYNITPNILCKIATAENVRGLEQFLRDTNMMADAEQYTFNKDINEETLKVPEHTIWETVSLISTHKGGDTVRSVFENLNFEERRQVMFQILYNMYVFDKLEISQGDLHSENILINVLPEEIDLCYIVEGVKYCFRTKHLVKYFDLDRGMIGKTTTLRFDKNQSVQMNQVDNPVRAPTFWVNKDYGVTSIYNKNLELVNLMTHETHGLLSNSMDRLRFRFVYPGKQVDEEFNNFIRDVMPGGRSNETIMDTYAELLKNQAQKAEADRIFGFVSLKLGKSETEADWIQRSIIKYAIDDDIKAMQWKDYFNFIKDKDTLLGHILKSIKPVKNNHLWIPDSIILTKLEMLRNKYFNKYIDMRAYDVTEEIVYTIDGMI
jgi:hypothetical protein